MSHGSWSSKEVSGVCIAPNPKPTGSPFRWSFDKLPASDLCLHNCFTNLEGFELASRLQVSRLSRLSNTAAAAASEFSPKAFGFDILFCIGPIAMKHSRHSQGSVESAAAEVTRSGFRTGDEEDGCDTSAYISRKSVKGNSVSGKWEIFEPCL